MDNSNRMDSSNRSGSGSGSEERKSSGGGAPVKQPAFIPKRKSSVNDMISQEIDKMLADETGGVESDGGGGGGDGGGGRAAAGQAGGVRRAGWRSDGRDEAR